MYSMSIETPEVTVEACQRCGMQDCHCQASGGGCYCQTIGHEWDDHVDPTPPPVTPPGGTGGGGGGSTGAEDDDQNSLSPKELMNVSKFVSYAISKDCMEGCKRILANYGINTPGSLLNAIQLLQRNGNVINTLAANYLDALNEINNHINNGRPIIVGIVYRYGDMTGNIDGLTNHFVVITGRGYDINTNQYYYTYMETGAINPSDGCNTDINRLYVDPNNPTVNGPTFTNPHGFVGNNPYHVTQVRPNNQ